MKKLMTIAAILLLATSNAHATSSEDNAPENAYASEQKMSLPTLGLGNLVSPPAAVAVRPMDYWACIWRAKNPHGLLKPGVRSYCLKAHREFMKLRRK